jgi:eukaryotic-like serine/threonine-protein kinase
MRNQVELLDDRYRVLTVLAAGGSSVVYLAHHAGLGREVAIKVLRPELFSSDRDVETYLREARIIAALNHPNILTVHDVGRLPDKRPYIVMEYVAGRSLSRMLEGGQVLPLDLAIDVFEQVASALGHAHRHGVIHRDIKPANILLRQHSTGRPQTKVADFGIASVAPQGEGHAPAYVGTPHYMSPEQAAGHAVVPASDFYSLGVVMYRALTGVRLFPDDDASALALHHLRTDVRPLRLVAPHLDVPEPLEAVVLRCLHKDPAQRYANADALLEALAEVRRVLNGPYGLVTSQESLDPPYLLQQPAKVAPGFPVAAPAPQSWLAPVAAAAGLFCAGVGIGLWLGW